MKQAIPASFRLKKFFHAKKISKIPEAMPQKRSFTIQG
jgi:hypothetical protein